MVDEEEQRLRPADALQTQRIDKLKLCLSASLWALGISVALWLMLT